MKKPTKKKPAPKPVIAWAVIENGKVQGEYCFNNRSDAEWFCVGNYDGVIRVRIVPVAAKRRKGGK